VCSSDLVVGLYSRETANRVVAEADLIFYVGTKTGSQTTHSWRVPGQDVDVIQCDIAPDVLGLNYRNVASLEGDARRSLELVLEAARALGRKPDRAAWKARVSSIVTTWYAAVRPLLDSDAVPMRPERLCREISDALPPNGVLVACTGNSGIWTASMVDLRSPDQRYLRAAGSLGWAFPAAIGAQCALPDRPVVAFTGDGGLWYHLAELETMARWNIPATIVVNNNSAFTQGVYLWEAAYGGKLHGRHHEMWQFRETNFANIAREMGVPATRVEQPSELAGALRDAIAADGPRLVEVITDRGAKSQKVYLPA
jgi:acetolactate synthase-1/2/3 large subunit